MKRHVTATATITYFTDEDAFDVRDEFNRLVDKLAGVIEKDTNGFIEVTSAVAADDYDNELALA